jgi:hypothetical protein
MVRLEKMMVLNNNKEQKITILPLFLAAWQACLWFGVQLFFTG